MSLDDIKYAFNKIANIRNAKDIEKKTSSVKTQKNESDRKLITAEDIEMVAEMLDEKLTKEEIEEMLNEAVEAGKLLKKDVGDSKKKVGDKGLDEMIDEEGNKPQEVNHKINQYEFKAILTWENSNN